MLDKSLITKRFARSLKEYNHLAIIQQQIAEQLAEGISKTIISTPCNGLEIGCGTGFLTNKLIEILPRTNWQAIDLVESCKNYIPNNIDFSIGDGEYFKTASQLDIIASSSTVQWFDNLPQFIKRTYNALNTNGILAISTFGPDNFLEITATTSQSLTYYTMIEIEEICNKTGYTILYSKEWNQKMNFNSPIEALHHIRATGVNSISTTRWTKSRLQQFNSDYIEKFGQATLTFHPQIIICIKK